MILKTKGRERGRGREKVSEDGKEGLKLAWGPGPPLSGLQSCGRRIEFVHQLSKTKWREERMKRKQKGRKKGWYASLHDSEAKYTTQPDRARGEERPQTGAVYRPASSRKKRKKNPEKRRKTNLQWA